jgi:thioredoxin 1
MADVLEVDEKSFDAEVLNSATPVLVDFWAPWCGPCRALSPTVDAVARELGGRLKVVKVNTDDARDLAVKYSVMSIPVLILFKGGKIVEQILGGGHPKDRIIQKLEPHLDSAAA